MWKGREFFVSLGDTHLRGTFRGTKREKVHCGFLEEKGKSKEWTVHRIVIDLPLEIYLREVERVLALTYGYRKLASHNLNTAVLWQLKVVDARHN